MAHEKVFTNIEHVAWLREQARLKRPYWYGCYYNPCTETLLQRKAKQYPSHYSAARMPTYRKHIAAGQIAGDCVNGAIKGAIWSELGKRAPVYASHGCPDKSADGMFEYCKKAGMDWGAIDSMPDLPGVAVRFAGHVGIYLGDGEVGEWRGFAYGMVVTKLKARQWTHWYALPWTEYVTTEAEDKPAAAPSMDVGALGSRLLKRGAKGEDVRTLQELLMRLGYKLPEYGADGDFGAETEKALRSFQLDKDLEVDGKYGPASHAALMNEIAEQSVQDDDEEDAAEQTAVQYVVVTGGTVNVRSGAGTQHDVITVVRKGARLKLIAIADNGWCAVDMDGMNGWISPKYTAIEGAE